jgi:formate dehydrogenase subunit gamma
MLRLVIQTCLAVLFLAATPATSQEVFPPTAAPSDRTATGGAQTLEDILARQRGLKVQDDFRANNTGDPADAAPITSPLGTLGGASDPELWRAIRYNSANITASSTTPGSKVLVQDGGMTWLQFRAGPLRTYGGYALLGMIGLLALFYLIRGRVRIESGKSGITIERFKPVERFGHWLVAGSFIVLGITGLISLFGRVGLIPYIGKDDYAIIAEVSKWIHNNVSWAFMLGLVLIFVMWVLHNIPNRHDLNWIIKAGGLLSKHSHPPAKKFNAGQKIVFWSVILFGASISLTGLSLLFPFELPMFAKTFSIINDIGIPGWFDAAPLPTTLAPHEEMQLAQLWHSIVAFVLMVIILGHIYIGTLGMEGAYDAMGDGDVDLNWAKEHHSLWVEEMQAKAGAEPALRTPAE